MCGIGWMGVNPETRWWWVEGISDLEMAEAFLRRGLEPPSFDMASQVMTTMDADMAGLIPPFLREAGVEVKAGGETGGIYIE